MGTTLAYSAGHARDQPSNGSALRPGVCSVPPSRRGMAPLLDQMASRDADSVRSSGVRHHARRLVRARTLSTTSDRAEALCHRFRDAVALCHRHGPANAGHYRGYFKSARVFSPRGYFKSAERGRRARDAQLQRTAALPPARARAAATAIATANESGIDTRPGLRSGNQAVVFFSTSI